MSSNLTAGLTPRQERERAFYDQYSRQTQRTDLDLDPVLAEERRPWNSYWRVYDHVREESSSREQQLLDFGCGCGRQAVLFAKLGYQVLGFDISSTNVAFAQQLAVRHGVADRTSFDVQVAEQLDYPSNKFDLVVGIDILHHCEVEKAVREVRRVLKPGGKAVFREHVEVPIIDPLRKSRLGLWAVARRRGSFEDQITQDEHNLTAQEMTIIRTVFPSIRQERFGLFGRLRKFTTRFRRPLLKADRFLFGALPFLRVFGSDVVMILQKTKGYEQ